MSIVDPFQMKYSFQIYSVLFCSILLHSIHSYPQLLLHFLLFHLWIPSAGLADQQQSENFGAQKVSVAIRKQNMFEMIWWGDLGEEGNMSVWSQKQMAANSGSLMVL